MRSHQFQDLLEKFSRGECSPEEEQLIMDWYAGIGGSPEETLPPGDKEAIEQRLWSALSPQLPARRNRMPRVFRVAAVLVPLMALAFFYFSHRPSAGTRPGDPIAVTVGDDRPYVLRNTGSGVRAFLLPDGSVVRLHPASEAILLNDFGRTSRELRLKGEGFFDVKRDEKKPFVVYANEVTTRVLGTSFTIRAYEDDREVTVAVKTGKVSVLTSRETPGADKPAAVREVILTPNQQVVYRRQDQEVLKHLVTEPDVILPFSSRFHMQFENAPVSRIFEALQENYGVTIRYDGNALSQCTLTTTLSEEDLFERIEVICKAIGASYSRDEDGVITIESNGCL